VSTPLGCKTALFRGSVKDAARQGEAGSLTLPWNSVTCRRSRQLSPRRAHDCRRQYHHPQGGE